MNIFDSLPIMAVMHGNVGIRAKELGILPGSPFCKTVDEGMIDRNIDSKGKSENSEWHKTVMNSLKECIKQDS